MRKLSCSFLMALFVALFILAPSSPLRAAEERITAVAYEYGGGGGVEGILEIGADGNASEPILLYSNRTNGPSGNALQRSIYITITTSSNKSLRLDKKGDNAGVLVMSDSSWRSGNTLSIDPEEVTVGVSDVTYQALFRLDVASVPSGGKTGIKIEIDQFGKGSANLVIPIEVVTLPETAGEQPKAIVLGSGSSTNSVSTEGGSPIWSQLLNGAHYSMDSKAGPLNRVITDIVYANDSPISMRQDDKGNWQFSFKDSENGGTGSFSKSAIFLQSAQATVHFVYDNGSSDHLGITFNYSAAEHPVSSMTIVPEGKKSIPRMLDSATETVYFSVYANKGNKSKEWVMNPYYSESSLYSPAETGFLDFKVETSDGEPSNVAKVVYNEDKGFCIVPDVDKTGSFTVKAFYTADESKFISMSFALVSENQEVYWRASSDVDDEASLSKAFPAAKFTSETVNTGSGTINNVHAVLYLSPTSGFFTGSLANYKDALIFKDAVSDYKDTTWKVEMGETTESKIVNASISGTKLTLKPVALGEATVKLVSYDTQYTVTMPVTVKMPDYTAVSIAYKSGKETITNYVYNGAAKAGRDDIYFTETESAAMSVYLTAGKSLSFKARYVNRDFSEKDFDMPQGNGYWYSTNPLYVTVSAAGTVKALGKPENGEEVKAVFVNNEGEKVIEITVEISAKAQVVDQWEKTVEVSYKQGKNRGTILTGGATGQILTVNLHDKPFTLTTTVKQTSSSNKTSVKKPKVYYVSSDPTKVHVSAKGVLTPVGETDGGAVDITVYSKDAGAGIKHITFKVKVLAPSN